MAWGIIPTTGPGAPCPPGSCAHNDCRVSLEQARSTCPECDTAIWYDRKFSYEAEARGGKIHHFECLAEKHRREHEARLRAHDLLFGSHSLPDGDQLAAVAENGLCPLEVSETFPGLAYKDVAATVEAGRQIARRRMAGAKEAP